MTLKNTLWVILLCMTAVVAGAETASLQLAQEGSSGYTIIGPEKPTAVDDYAITILTNFLFEKTGASFPVVALDVALPEKKRIFVGLSAPMRQTLMPDPPLALEDQEYVCRSVGEDIALYGEGIHGNFHAVLDFMETTLGRRWYTRFDPPVFRVEPNLVVVPFERKRGFAFAYRGVPFNSVFSYQQGMNMGFTEYRSAVRAAAWVNERLNGTVNNGLIEGQQAQLWLDACTPPGMVSAKSTIGGHCLFGYIPPYPEKSAHSLPPFDWIANKNYFKTNPEFFTLNKAGQRISEHQLCFSNPTLRKELTANILEHIRRSDNPSLIVNLFANDQDGRFCECPDCIKLEEKYACPGGPMFDYLFEFCPTLEIQYPEMTVLTIAYFQTREPPTLPAGMIFPRNLSVQYCTVKESCNLEWTHPRNQPAYEEFLRWSKLASHLWTWVYPNPFGRRGAPYLPSGIIQRMVADMRLMKQANCEGIYFEYSSASAWGGDGFTELQIYLYCKLTQDVNSDVPTLIAEFTEYQYGAAASLARKYRDELEKAQRALKVRMSMWQRSIDFYGQHAYLSLENIRRWQGYFDRMEKDTASDPRCLENVWRLRRTLEFSTLARWNDLAQKYSDYFVDYQVHRARLDRGRPPFRSMRAEEKAAVEDFEAAITLKASCKEKPLPPPFDTLDPSRVHRFTPVNTQDPKPVIDTDAAFGFAALVDLPDIPFHFGFHPGEGWATRDPTALRPLPPNAVASWQRTQSQTFTLQRALTLPDIEPDVYKMYALSDVEVTPNCQIWFSAKSWSTTLAVGARLYEAGANNHYDVHVSLKFEGPTYGGQTDNDRVLCDQILLVRKAD